MFASCCRHTRPIKDDWVWEDTTSNASTDYESVDGELSEVESTTSRYSKKRQSNRTPSRKHKEAPRSPPQSSLERSTSDHDAAKLKGNECYNLSQYEEAVKWYTKALAIAPAADPTFRATVLTNRAECYRQMRLDEQCIGDCTEALKLKPDNVKALIRRGLAYEQAEKSKLALADLSAALQLAPGSKVASEGVMRLTNTLRRAERRLSRGSSRAGGR
uniref:Uncharacterized protein n=1 Tax=Pyramimonas obovata TaxID=1411642 RepID=A0A7S0N080_9CHLO|mmetsp:Transcript_17620/g.38444  ORF Transcript_17620/g.38444 Transcript_17620/m.38444 type:complete len:217 (+) Transcript_17620:258-908(+)